MLKVLPYEENAFPQRRGLECVEIYLPKKLRLLSELYAFLRAKTTETVGDIVLDGFSMYEVDGVFRGKEQLWEERSLVIRILFPCSDDPHVVQSKIVDLGREIAAKVAMKEEEIWICQYRQKLSVFRPKPRRNKR